MTHHLKYYFLYILLFVFIVSCQKEQQEQSDTKLDFGAFSSQFIDDYWEQNPTSATYNGYHKYDDQLPLPDPEARRDAVAWNQKKLNDLKTIDKEQLNESELVDYELIKNQLESSLWYANQFKSFEWDLSRYNLGSLFFYTLKGDLPLNDRLLNASARLNRVPEYYAAAKNNTAFPVLERVQMGIKQIPSSLDVIETAILDSLEQSTLDEEQANTLRNRVNLAKKAVEDYVSYLEDLESSNEQFRTYRIGQELYDKKFKLDINSGLTARENYDEALQAKKDVHEQMIRLSEQLWPKYFPNKLQPQGLKAVAELIEVISQNHTTKEDFVTEVRRQVPELESFVKEHDLIYLDPSKPLVIRETPKYMRGFAGASVSAPGPYDKQGDTYYNVTPINDWPDEQATSYLEEYNDYMLQILNIHEAIPGHYTQLVYSNESPSLVKSIFGNGAMIEGWACFAERMMLENGYGDGDTKDELMLMYYKWNLRIIANSILDYGIHVENWTEEQVMDLLINEAFQEQAEAEGKWHRATISSVQLTSYFNGLTEIQQLKDEIEAKEGEEFSIKAFNEQFLSYGSAPVRLIRELMLSDD